MLADFIVNLVVAVLLFRENRLAQPNQESEDHKHPEGTHDGPPVCHN
jgi:hypothetical protein